MLFIAFAGPIPNDELWKTELNLNCLGPISDGTYFPDPIKMGLTLNYLKEVLSKPGMHEACSNYIDRAFKNNHNGVSYADTFLNQMMGEYYTAEGDEMLGTKDALDRIHHSLHAKACFAEVFGVLLQHQLKTCIDAKREGKEAKYHTLPIVQDILIPNCGAQDALKKAVEAFAQLWTRFGPFVLCDISAIMQDGDDVSKESLHSVQHEVNRLSDHIGAVVNCLVILNSKQAYEDAFSLVKFIKSILLRQVDGMRGIEPLLGRMSKDKFIEEIELRFMIAIK